MIETWTSGSAFQWISKKSQYTHIQIYRHCSQNSQQHEDFQICWKWNKNPNGRINKWVLPLTDYRFYYVCVCNTDDTDSVYYNVVSCIHISLLHFICHFDALFRCKSLKWKWSSNVVKRSKEIQTVYEMLTNNNTEQVGREIAIIIIKKKMPVSKCTPSLNIGPSTYE